MNKSSCQYKKTQYQFGRCRNDTGPQSSVQRAALKLALLRLGPLKHTQEGFRRGVHVALLAPQTTND